MAKETEKYDEDYLNGLIAKAKKSWEGVDVDSFMSDLRDDSFYKEVVEELSKKATSYITEQIKSNMNTVIIKCRDLMVGDWCCDQHGFQWQIIGVGDDYAYATFEGNEGDPWEFDDKDEQPQPISLTPEILEKNGWKHHAIFMDLEVADNINFSWTDMYGESLFQNSHHMCDCKYVHTLQHALRLCKLNELADNFKV